MRRGIIYEADYRPLFSGHETFTLRYGWLKKVYDAVKNSADQLGNKSIFLNDDAIARFGVGKNMVRSMRHWSLACGIISEESKTGQLSTTVLGDFLLGDNGIDPFLENPGSIWLLHWNLCSGDASEGLKTTWYWAVNYFSDPIFTRDRLVEKLAQIAAEREWGSGSHVTLKRDVECFVRSYEYRAMHDASSIEESLDSIFAELGLIARSDSHSFSFVRGEKNTLPSSIFIYALNHFWQRIGDTKSLSFDAIAYDIGSPGRVFMLDEQALGERLLALEGLTKGVFSWSETAGLRQVLRTHFLDDSDTYELIKNEYEFTFSGALS